MILGSTYFTANEKVAQSVLKSRTVYTKKLDRVYEKVRKAEILYFFPPQGAIVYIMYSV